MIKDPMEAVGDVRDAKSSPNPHSSPNDPPRASTQETIPPPRLFNEAAVKERSQVEVLSREGYPLPWRWERSVTREVLGGTGLAIVFCAFLIAAPGIFLDISRTQTPTPPTLPYAPPPLPIPADPNQSTPTGAPPEVKADVIQSGKTTDNPAPPPTPPLVQAEPDSPKQTAAPPPRAVGTAEPQATKAGPQPSGPTDVNCAEPPMPSMPDGRTATAAEMSAADDAVKTHFAALDAYQQCVFREVNRPVQSTAQVRLSDPKIELGRRLDAIQNSRRQVQAAYTAATRSYAQANQPRAAAP